MTLAARTTGGVAKVSLTTGGDSYYTPPTVSFSGGGGNGAAGLAIMAGTRVDSVLITNAGTNYTASPAVTLTAVSASATVSSATSNATQSFLVFNPALAATTHQRVVVSGVTEPLTFTSNTVGLVAASTFTNTGQAFLYAGTGAAATAFAYTGTLQPLSFFKGRQNVVYGVDGMGRGIRWDTSANTTYPIGLAKPAATVSLTANSTGGATEIKAIHILAGGNGYAREPTVVISGGTPDRPAKARAQIAFGRVSTISIIDRGAGYQATPTVSLTGGMGTTASFTVSVTGRVNTIAIVNPGSGYTTSVTHAPTVMVNNSEGLSDVYAVLIVGEDRKIAAVNLLSGGTGATTTGAYLSVEGGGGSGATLSMGMLFELATVNVSNSGSGYYSPPIINIRAKPSDTFGGGAAVLASVNSTGNVSGVETINGGQYSLPPTAVIEDTRAVVEAELTQPLRGTYLCAIRYVDDTPASNGGPLASSISDLAELEISEGTGALTWTLSHPSPDARAHAVELWRTTADQSVVLFRVATLYKTGGNFPTTYADSLSDSQLIDVERDGYGLMPITLPSGQINARRFEIPPGEMSVGCMFQDRAWYAVDSTGQKPNSLYYSEVDEPESVPQANELIIQENTGDPDKLVALIPLGGYLILAQSFHLYKLSYVAQPVIDASIILVAYRGILNSRCWDVMDGVAFIADGTGMYAFDGQSEESISVAVDNLWRDGAIDFSKSAKFHVRAEYSTKTVRFYYCGPNDTEPTKALCYCVATKAWWQESYAQAVTATCPVISGGKRVEISALNNATFAKFSGTQDGTTGVEYRLRTGAFPLATERGSRAVSFTYDPTTSDSTLRLRLYYNNSSTPRTNAAATNRGTGFVTDTGSTEATLNMAATRSPLGEATGHATASLAGRVDEHSAGADRDVAIEFAGTQTSDKVTFYSVNVEGAG